MSEVEQATVVWHEPALFDAPVTHMRVPLAVRASVLTATDPRCYRTLWVPVAVDSTVAEAAHNGDFEWLDDWLTGEVEYRHAGAMVLDDEVRRIARALTHPRTMPIPGGAR